MSNMFYRCYSLISLPDISKWDTSNVENLDGMFFDSILLLCLPDISKWNTYKVKNLNGMFSDSNLLYTYLCYNEKDKKFYKLIKI